MGFTKMLNLIICYQKSRKMHFTKMLMYVILLSYCQITENLVVHIWSSINEDFPINNFVWKQLLHHIWEIFNCRRQKSHTKQVLKLMYMYTYDVNIPNTVFISIIIEKLLKITLKLSRHITPPYPTCTCMYTL